MNNKTERVAVRIPKWQKETLKKIAKEKSKISIAETGLKTTVSGVFREAINEKIEKEHRKV